MNYDNIIYDVGDEVATITLDRPNSLNALSIELSDELEDALDRIDGDRDVRFVVFKGSGGNFCAGDDITEMPEWGDPADVQHRIKTYQNLSLTIQNLEQIAIAAVDGYATGGGLEITLACDFVIATDRAKWGMPEVNWGITPGWGGTTKLTRYIGLRKAKEVNMIGALQPVEDAIEYDLWNRMVPVDELDDEVGRLLEVLKSKNPQTLRQLKFVLNYGAETPLPLAMGFEQMNEALSASNAWDVGPVRDSEPGEGLESFRSKNDLYARRRELSDTFWSDVDMDS